MSAGRITVIDPVKTKGREPFRQFDLLNPDPFLTFWMDAFCLAIKRSLPSALLHQFLQGVSAEQYWVAGVEAYFDAAGDRPSPYSADQPVTTRETLKAYDPDLYALVAETMAYRGHVDWRYTRPRPGE